MIRETSIEAYHEVTDGGMIGRRQKQVYEILYELGPLAGAQVANVFQQRHGKTARSETVRNRITELRDFGVVREVGHVIDPHTKMRVILWDVTSKKPVKYIKPPTKRQIIERLTREISDLRLKLEVS